jgi:DNA-binding transcriptional ArsR family regulator
MRRDVFQAIADPTRREIINLIAAQPLNLNSIAENFEVSRPAISQQGRERYCEAQLQPLGEVASWLERYRKMWEEKFESLDDLLEKIQSKSKKASSRKRKK